jgi:hypothetical protein
MRRKLPVSAMILTSLFLLAASLSAAAPFGPATLPSASPASRPTARQLQEIEALLMKLDSEDYRTRDRALARLIEIGPPAKERLEHFSRGTPSNEARDRANLALHTIRQNEAMGPTFVTIRLKSGSIQEAAAELTRAGGRRFDVKPAGENAGWRWRAANLDIRHRPFWQAAHEVCEAFGARPYFGAADGAVTLVPNAEWVKRPWRSVPGCLVVFDSAERIPVRDQDLDRQTGRGTRLRFEVYPDPALRPLTHTQYLETAEAKDELGQSLIPPKPISQAVGSGSGTFSFETGVFQPFNKPGGERLASFKGKAGLLLQTEGETFEMKDLLTAKNVTRRVAGMQVTAHDASAVPGGYAVRMTAVRDGAEERVWDLARDLYHPLAPRLISRNDATRLWVVQSDANARRTNDRVDATVVFLDGTGHGAVPDKMVWELPTKTRVLEIPIEFEDLPLAE